MIKNHRFFASILLISALVLSFCAAYFSVYGISSLFSGAVVSVSIMAGALEIAKLISSSFLFRFWNKTKMFLKIYMLTGVFVLLIITSMGIFGYLSAAYQKSSTENKILMEHVGLINGQKTIMLDRIEQSKKRIEFITKLRTEQEKRLSDMLNNESITRNIIQLQEVQSQTSDLITKSDMDVDKENKKIQDSTDQITKLNEDVSALKIKSLEKKDITTFQFVADSLGVNINTVVKWFILALICVFDPLAVAMLLAYNSLIADDSLESTSTKTNSNAESTAISTVYNKIEERANEPRKESRFKKILRKPFSHLIRN